MGCGVKVSLRSPFRGHGFPPGCRAVSVIPRSVEQRSSSVQRHRIASGGPAGGRRSTGYSVLSEIGIPRFLNVIVVAHAAEVWWRSLGRCSVVVWRITIRNKWWRSPQAVVENIFESSAAQFQPFSCLRLAGAHRRTRSAIHRTGPVSPSPRRVNEVRTRPRNRRNARRPRPGAGPK